MNRLSLAALVIVATRTLAGGAEPAALQTIVRGEFLYETAPFPQCHASTIAETPRGLVAAWFGGTREGAADVGIWVSRRENDQWTPPTEVATGLQVDGSRHPCWNPVLFQMPRGALLLFYKVGPKPSSWWGMQTTSADGGRTWSEPRRLPDDIAGPIKNKPILLADDRLLCPSSTENQGWRVHLEWTKDGGKTWERTAALCDGLTQHAIQPTVLRHGERLQMLCRNRASGPLWQTWSDDAGRTWTKLEPAALPHPGSGIDGVTLADGRQLLVYNHTTKGRSPLNVAVSENGRQWLAALVLEDQPGEYSYPAVIQAKDGMVHITYTWKRQRVKHIVVDPAHLAGKPIVDGQWPQK
ncbi:MAG: sialidase family protein [Pirellulaceae bacterium]|nr:sialidase family protein [Pirellulaceae bacterium]